MSLTPLVDDRHRSNRRVCKTLRFANADSLIPAHRCKPHESAIYARHHAKTPVFIDFQSILLFRFAVEKPPLATIQKPENRFPPSGIDVALPVIVLGVWNRP